MKKLFIDLETTGLNPVVDDIIEISAIVEIGNTVKYEFTIFPAPDNVEMISDNLLGKLNLTREQIVKRSIPQKKAFEQVKTFLEMFIDKFDSSDKFFFLAYNSPFDNGFLREFWKRNGDNYFGSYFWHPDICIMRMAADYLMDSRRELENFKQSTVARHLGIDVNEEQLHGGMYDIQLARQIYHKIIDERRCYDGTIQQHTADER